MCLLALVLGVARGCHRRRDLPTASTTRRAWSSDGLGGVDTVTAAPLPDDNGSVPAVAQQLLPSTVQISAEYEGKKGGATGSGFVLDKQGHVITNNHVVAEAAEDDGPIEIVDQDGNRYDAKVVGRSPVYDLAVLYSEGRQWPRPGVAGCLAALRVGDGGGRHRLAARTQLDGHRRHRQRAPPAGDHRRLDQRLVVHQRRADRCRDQPRQLRRPAGQPAGPGRRRQLRDRHDRRQPRRRFRQHRRRVRDPDRAGPDHRRPDPAHRRGPLPGDRREGGDRPGRHAAPRSTPSAGHPRRGQRPARTTTW